MPLWNQLPSLEPEICRERILHALTCPARMEQQDSRPAQVRPTAPAVPSLCHTYNGVHITWLWEAVAAEEPRPCRNFSRRAFCPPAVCVRKESPDSEIKTVNFSAAADGRLMILPVR
ncbi:uncharacterized protein K452DRAFT_307474 [Aplosporella prunicola CBS 121167]|uniref:Uncharacterized protein n=1 Tax=Aplosporella prunicola CBS 121167 TaxID=1176127 RepID=A0A6A6BJ66_9PEZI|nr:uncharacterized protein K452DRAFT_307474 [Aplosporella prunicola CBS 121167]KAF2143324.1 hypothetical protein K452DRAFT_307474 [Aplosporella prunicola CBS 121167]